MEKTTDIGAGKRAGPGIDGASAAGHSRGRPAKPISPGDALEIVAAAILRAYQVGVNVQRMNVDGEPGFLFRGCKVDDGKLVPIIDDLAVDK